MSSTTELTTWITRCQTAARNDPDPLARAAYEGMAAEFAAIAAEIEGLVASYEALKAGCPEAA
jgi:hypothetical protein